MGAVYRATQLELDREVAIKMIRAGLSERPDSVKRFLRESRLAAKLAHPNMVAIQEMGQSEDGSLFLVMEYLRGRPLSQVIADEAPMEPQRAAWIAYQVSDLLEAAYHQKIVHRDLKPQNILILDEPAGRDFVKVLDFGLAKSLDHDGTTTKSGAILGTPAYISPEMLLHGESDVRSDIYSLGVVLYELLTGAPPFGADTVHAIMMKQAYEPMPDLPAHIPPNLATVVAKMLEKAPADRIGTPAELRAALQVACGLVEESGAARSWQIPTQTGPRVPAVAAAVSVEASAPPRRRRAPLWIGAGVSLCAVLAAFFYFAQGHEAAPPSESAPGVGGPAQPVAASASANETAAKGPEQEPERPKPVELEAQPEEDESEAPPTPAKKEHAVWLRSKPEARVFLAGKDLGKTPLEYRFASGDEEVEVEFRRKGFVSTTRSFSPKDSAEISVKLRRRGRNRGERKPKTKPKDRESALPF
jgi:serine/threonine-protein kinase